MTPAGRTIDLGELPPQDAPHPAPYPAPGWRGSLRRRNPLSRRVLGAAALAVLMVSGLAAAAPARAALELRLTVTGEQSFIDGQHLYLIAEGGGGDRRLAAYRLSDGGLAWDLELSNDPGDHTLLLRLGPIGVAMANYSTGGDENQPPSEQFTLLDPATGAERWMQTGFPIQVLDDLLLLYRQLPDQPDLDQPSLIEILAVEVATGDVRWGPRPISGQFAQEFQPPYRGVTLTEDGGLVSLDLTTGQELTTAPFADGLHADPHIFDLVGATVLVGDGPDSDTPTISGYQLDGLEPLWTIDVDRYGWPSRCGDWFCLNSASALQAFDPATGSTVWSTDSFTGQVSIGGLGHRLADPLGQLAVIYEGGPEFRQWLVDSETGDLVLELGDWQLITGSDLADGEPLWVFMEGAGDRPSWVGWLRADLSGVDPIGPVGEASHCQAWQQYLTCGWENQDAGQSLAVWHFRR